MKRRFAETLRKKGRRAFQSHTHILLDLRRRFIHSLTEVKYVFLTGQVLKLSCIKQTS